jgi:hypothetical protein
MKTADIMEEVAEAGGSDINIHRTLKAIIKEFGGPEQFAKEVVSDFRALEAGHAARVRISTALLTSLGTYGSDDDGDGDDIESVTAELKAIVEMSGKEDPDDG